MSIEDSLIRRQIFVQQFASGEAQSAQQLLDTLFGEVAERLEDAEEEFERQQFTDLREILDRIIGNSLDEIDETVTENILEYSEDESDFTTEAIQLATIVATVIPVAAAVRAVVTRERMKPTVGIDEITIKEAMNQFKTKKKNDIFQALNDGILNGTKPSDIASELRNSLRLRQRAQLDTLIRTSVNHAASMARRTTVLENRHLFSGEEWVSVLDGHTSLICAGRGGRIYPVGKGEYPPAHWNCRSIRVPILKNEFAKKKHRKRKKTNFDGWLRTQSGDFQDKYFSRFPDGKDKVTAFRKGLEIDRFRDETGKNFTLDQLKALNPVIFSK